jgi:hypothetical protein
MVSSGGSGCAGRRPAIVQKGVINPTCLVTELGPVSTVQCSLRPADILEAPEAYSSRNRPCRPVHDPLRLSQTTGRLFDR